MFLCVVRVCVGSVRCRRLFCGHRDHLCEHQACLWWFRLKLPAKICFFFFLSLLARQIYIRADWAMLMTGAAQNQACFLARTCLSFRDPLMSLFHLKQSRALLSGCWTFGRRLCNGVSSAFPLSFATHFGVLVCGSVSPQCGYETVPINTAKHSQNVHTCFYTHVLQHRIRNCLLLQHKRLHCCRTSVLRQDTPAGKVA